jgi:hypothetical protein
MISEQAILDAASAIAGQPLSDPADLGGSHRSTVLRCRTPDGGTVVVKTYPKSHNGLWSFAAETSGLAFSAPAGLSPVLLGTDPDIPLVVMTDLGTWPSRRSRRRCLRVRYWDPRAEGPRVPIERQARSTRLAIPCRPILGPGQRDARPAIRHAVLAVPRPPALSRLPALAPATATLADR